MKKRGPKPMPVRVRGTVYNSVKECAAAFGVSEGTVYSALTRGRMDYLGLGVNWDRYQRRGVEMTLAGKKFPSQKAVDRFLGKTHQYTGDLIRKKQLHKLEQQVADRLRKQLDQSEQVDG